MTTPVARTTDTDVLISGAGPVGLTLALALAARGVRSVVLERKDRLDPHSRATLITPRSLEILAALGVLPAMIAQGQVNPALDILRAGDHRRLLRFDFAAADDQSAVPFAIAIPQDRTERILLDAANATGLIDVRFASPLQDFTADNVAVTATTGPHPDLVRARYLVGADGAHSTVRTQLGWTLHGTTYPTRAYLADVRVNASADLTNGWLSDPKAPAFTIAVRFSGDASGGTWRLIESAIPDSVTDNQLDSRARVITERLFGAGAWQETLWTSAYRKHERRAATYRQGRVLLAGDAAHLNSPAGGQGLNTGLQDVQSLAWRLASLIDGIGDDNALLDSYSAERTRAFDIDVRPLTDGIERMETLPARLRAVAFSGVALLRRTPMPGLIARKLSMLTPSPARSALISGNDPAGKRLPDIELPDGQRLHHHFGPAGLLLTHDGTAPSDLPSDLTVLATPTNLPTSYTQAVALLVRPDHLIGAVYRQQPSAHDINIALGRSHSVTAGAACDRGVSEVVLGDGAVSD